MNIPAISKISKKASENRAFRRYAAFGFEWLIILIVTYLYAGALLDFNPMRLQQTGEHNESSTRPLLAEIALKRYSEIPFWNHYMLTGFPAVGDMLGHFWSPISTIPIWIWGGINGMKVSVFLAFFLAGLGQWYLSYVAGLRGIFRLWSSLLFMMSGGLSMLWRVGWYELLLGIAWFPWTFASYWQAIHKRDLTSIIWAAFCAAMVLLTGGGYYPFYLAGSAGIILLIAFAVSKENWARFLRRSVRTALIAFGFIAVMAVPIYDGYRLIIRESGADPYRAGSQPIDYAIFNYIISERAWFNTPILGTMSGWNWFYMGSLSLAALMALPLAFRRTKHRPVRLAMTVLAVFLLAWQANRYAPINYIYEWFPFFTQLRFPSRLLYVAAIPILIMSAASMQGLFGVARPWFARYKIGLTFQKEGSQSMSSLRRLFGLAVSLLLISNLHSVYQINKDFTFAPFPLNQKSYATLEWLHKLDGSLYYVNIGGGSIWWDWTPAAYDLEIPVINFAYNQHLSTQDKQHASGSPFFATAKYQISRMDEPPTGRATFLAEFDGVGVWQNNDALPFAFSARPEFLVGGEKLDRTHAVAIPNVAFQGSNRIRVIGEPGQAGDRLVVLVSNYPGWKVLVDGEPAVLRPTNDYLGVQMLPGKHTYIFVFDPLLFRIGLGITILTIISAVLVLAREGTALKRLGSTRQGWKTNESN